MPAAAPAWRISSQAPVTRSMRRRTEPAHLWSPGGPRAAGPRGGRRGGWRRSATAQAAKSARARSATSSGFSSQMKWPESSTHSIVRSSAWSSTPSSRPLRDGPVVGAEQEARGLGQALRGQTLRAPASAHRGAHVGAVELLGGVRRGGPGQRSGVDQRVLLGERGRSCTTSARMAPASRSGWVRVNHAPPAASAKAYHMRHASSSTAGERLIHGGTVLATSSFWTRSGRSSAIAKAAAPPQSCPPTQAVLDLQRVHQGHRVAGEGQRVVAVPGGVAPAEAAQVGRDHPVVGGQARDHAAPAPRVLGPAVQQQHRRAAARLVEVDAPACRRPWSGSGPCAGSRLRRLGECSSPRPVG